jgi:pimeloyl-ACP methyl ester carboxylesterase
LGICVLINESWYYAATPHISFVDIADSAHFVMLDQPAAFQAALMGFVGK